MSSTLFAAIADDFTGGSDLAGMLFEQGVRTVQTFGIPEPDFALRLEGRYDAVVVCVKTRSTEPAEACRISVDAFDRISAWNPAQVQFKYCSTFDSTPRGNIGPVTDALMRRLGTEFTIAVPALPVNRRTQYQGYLFVLGQLLSESPMRNHPLNPMTDSNLVRWLGLQTSRRVGLVPLERVQAGPAAIRAEYARLQEQGIEIALVDVAVERDLGAIAEASASLPLITGGSGLAMKLPSVWRARGALRSGNLHTARELPGKGTLILSGSCSAATLQQLERLESGGCAVERLDAIALMKDAPAEIERLARVASVCLARSGVAAIRSSAPAGQRMDAAAEPIEHAFGEIARRIVASARAGRIIVAGGETSGAVVNALGVRAVEITGIIDPGVPGLMSCDEPRIAMALKSGNFGAPDFFEKTMRLWEHQDRA